MSNLELRYTDEELQSWRDWVGHRVSISGVKFGVLRYFGETEFSAGIWCGVELDEPVGKNNGVVKGVRYFTCEENYGIFAPLAKTSKLTDDGQLGTLRKPIRSKLPSPKVKCNQGSVLNRTFHPKPDVTKDGLPNNANNEVNIMNETFRKLCDEISVCSGPQQLSFCPSANNNVRKSSDNTANVSLNTHFSTSSVQNVGRPSNLLNQTVTFNNKDSNENIVHGTLPRFDVTSSFLENDLLQHSMKSLPLNISNSSSNRRDSTFILKPINTELTKEELEKPDQDCFGSNENLLSVDFDESLGILSPSEMKDFTSSFETTFVNVTERLPGIPKNESCDDVNDLPESEVVSSDTLNSEETLIPSMRDMESTLTNNALNSVTKLKMDDSMFCKSNASLCKVVPRELDGTFCQTEENLLQESMGNLQGSAGVHFCKQLDNKEAFEYIHFSASLGAVQSLNSSFDVAGAPKDHCESDTESHMLVGMSSVTHQENLANVAKMPVTSNLNDQFRINCSNQKNLALNKHLSNVLDNRLSFSPIASQTLPNICNISDLDKDIRNSLSFLGAPPSPVNDSVSSCKNLINFSFDSPMLRTTASNVVTDCAQVENVDEALPQPEVLDEKPQSSPNTEKSPEMKLIDFSVGSETDCDVIAVPGPLCPEVFHDLLINFSPKAQLPDESQKIGCCVENVVTGGSTSPLSSGNEILDGGNLLLNDAVVIPNSNEKLQDNHNEGRTEDIMILDPLICGSDCAVTDILNEMRDVSHPLVKELDSSPCQTVEINEVGDPLNLNSNDNAYSFNAADSELVSVKMPVVLNETVCLEPSAVQGLPDQFDVVNSLPHDLNRTFSGAKLQNLLSETIAVHEGALDPIMDLSNKVANDTQILSSQSFTADSNNSPSFIGKIEDISVISGDGTCFEISDVFDSEEVFSPTAEKHNATFQVLPSSTQGKSNENSPSTARRKSMFNFSTSKAAGNKQPGLVQGAAKPLKKNIVSKVKMMMESKNSSNTNQENINVKNVASTQKKAGKWDAITSKISAGLTKNKTPEMKKDIASRINTNLNITRHSTPKTSPGRTAVKTEKAKDDKKVQILEATAAKNLKNALNTQRVTDNKSNVDGGTGSKESRILTQLQNVESSTQSSDGFKVPLFPLKKKRICSQLPSPSGSASSASCIPSMSKIASLPKRNIASKVPNTSASVGKPSIPTSQPPALKATRSTVVGKPKEPLAKEPKSNRWSSGVTTKPGSRSEPRKFVSKTELVREIQELGANCENRTKELNLLKMRLRHAALGFEAMAVLNKYMVEEFDPFAQPRLARQYEKAKEELSKVGQQLHLYQDQLKDLQTIHAEELMELTEKLGVVHADEISELKLAHVAELAEVDQHHKQQIKQLRETFKKQAEENEEQNCQMFRDLQEGYQKQKKDLEANHVKKLRAMAAHHEEVQHQLQKRLESLNQQYSSLQKQLREAEEAFMKDKSSKIQYISAKKTELEKEVDSLKAVLEIKTTQIQDLHVENFKIKKELEELPAAKEKIRKLETKTEDLKALMQEKMKLHRELSTENQQLVLVCEKEAKNNSRLSMANEELLWRLHQSMEAGVRSSSLCGSPDLWNREDDDQRSSSRMSLPILQSEKLRSESENSLAGTASSARADDWSSSRGHSMSLSWHPALPTHAESPLMPKTSTPQPRERSRSARGPRFPLPSQVKLSSMKLKKDIEAEILRRNSSIGRKASLDKPSVLSHPMSMSWGGESFADYYEELDDSSLQLYNDQRSGLGRKFFVKYENYDKPKRGRRSRHTIGPDAEIDIDKSISGLTSLQSSFHSSTDSSSSYVPTQPGSEASNSSSPSSDNKSQDSNGYHLSYDIPASCVKPPQDLAGESMIQEMESLSQALLQAGGNLKKEAFLGLTDVSSSSPEDGKDNAVNLTSMATPSMETSSQGMADSTNLDVSWGDEEMPSEND